jgi:L-cysteine:1D-myo-inositol 2-amino-2-deoxy-alpha-D-glucopyranoside ligase
VITGIPWARHYAHAGMVGLDGEKMSKSKGNLVKVSVLRAQGVDPMAIRLALLAHHYRSDWMWTDSVLADAERRLATWRAAMSREGGPAAQETIDTVRARIGDDLDAPGALAAVDEWAGRALAHGGDDPGAPGVLSRAVNAILGVRF